MAQPISTTAVLDAIREDYAEHGAEFVYSLDGTPGTVGAACYYRTPVFEDVDGYGQEFVRSEGAAGCFVGRILDRLGVLPAVLYPSTMKPRLDDPTVAIENADATAAIDRLGVCFMDGPSIISGLYSAQQRQDSGDSLDHVVEAFALAVGISVDDLGFVL